MEVILLEKVHNLGRVGDKVNVKPGYGRNYLIPQGKAVSATKENLLRFEERRAELEKIEAEHVSAAQQRVQALANLDIKLPAKVGDEGKLYGSIGTKDIAQAITKMGVQVSKSEVRLPNGVIRVIGDHEVVLHLHSDVDAKVIVHIVPEA